MRNKVFIACWLGVVWSGFVFPAPAQPSLADTIERVIKISEHLGIIGFFVDAKDYAAKTFYEQFGFISLPDNPLELFLPLTTIKKAYAMMSKRDL